MLIKSCTQENDDVFILFGGSGSEIILCKELKRNFISCELHPKYYEMIQDRLANKGKISEKYRLEFVQKKKKMSIEDVPKLFDFETKNNNT